MSEDSLPQQSDQEFDAMLPAVSVRDARSEDLSAIRPILEAWVRDGETGQILNEEVDSICSAIDESVNGNNERVYLIAEDNEGNIAGLMGLVPPDEDMRKFAESERPAEFINAFVNNDLRLQGIGTKLVAKLEERAKSLGYTEIVVNSGPRYRESGWAFWTKVFGEPIAIQKDLYGTGRDAPVWHKIL